MSEQSFGTSYITVSTLEVSAC